MTKTKNVKRLVVFALIAILAVSALVAVFAGCQDTETFKVGAIYINSKTDTEGYTYAHHSAIVKAMKELGLDPNTQLLIQDEVREDDTEVKNAVDTLVNQGANMIIGISFGYINALNAAAETYPDVVFSHATGYLSNDTNFNNYFGRIYQARYLSGIAAGLKLKELGGGDAGYVAAYDVEYAETASGINAFALGVQAVSPNSKVYVRKLNAWADASNERRFAEDLINTNNCKVIAQHCDSAQPQLAAQAGNVFGCGYNSDMTANAPSAHLTAPIWNWDVYYKLAIKAAKESPSTYIETVGKAYYSGLKEGLVDISPLSANCAEGTDGAIALVRQMIISGEWDVFDGVKLSIDLVDGQWVATKTSVGHGKLSNDFTSTADSKCPDSVITGTMNTLVDGVIAVGASN